MDFTSNLRVWMWLLMAVGLAAGVAEATMRAGSAVRLLRAGGIAVAVVVAIGFLEVYFGSRFDSLFQLFRPNWTALGLRGPGPENILEVHAIVGASARLMSTLGNDVVFFLPLGSILAASAYLGALTSGRRVASLGWLVLGGATGWAVLLTLSRTAIGLTLAGLVLFALLTSRQGWAATVWHPAMLFVALLTVNITVTDTSLVAKLRGMDALLKSVPAASKPPTIEAGPTASAGLRAPEALGVEVRGKVASSSLETTIARWSINQRAIMASIAVDFARHNPVFGIGLWNFRTRLYERGGRWDELGLRELVKDVQCPHSFFLWLAAVAGVPGAILGAAVFAACLLSLARHWRQNPEHRLATSALIAAWVVLTGFALFGFTFLTTTAVGTFGSLVGATSGYLGRSSRSSGHL